MVSRLEVIPLEGIPEIRPGDDLAHALIGGVDTAGETLADGDVLVVTHKVVSKAEGRIAEALDDGAYRRLIEDEAASVVRRRGDLVITKTTHGFICANAGVDRSNTEPSTAVLLPRDPDRSAHTLRMSLLHRTGVDLPVIITDTFGRAWRKGLSDVAIGVSGIDPILDLRGTIDDHGRELKVTEIAVADEIAAAADLAMGKTTATPAALIRGLGLPRGDGRATDLVREPDGDLFR